MIEKNEAVKSADERDCTLIVSELVARIISLQIASEVAQSEKSD